MMEIPYPHVDPVAINLPGPVDVRWYGISYLVAFALGYAVLRWLSRHEYLRLDAEAIGDLVFVLIVGTILGGRIGYVLFYNFPEFAAHPVQILRIWEGGLSFHGGLIGVLLAAWWFTRRHRVSFLHLGDALALAVPFGIFSVRIANFVNGELYGRIASPSVPWAMRFPTDPVALRLIGAQGLGIRARELLIDRAYASGRWAMIRGVVPLRHPSQLYEAGTEGLLLAVFVWSVFLWARRRGLRLPEGTLGGTFLLGYGVFRSLVEEYRQPDVQFRGPGNPLGTVLGPFTMGQVLSSFMIVAGLGLLLWSWLRVRRGVRDRG
ncbi:MAG TPA: prolipoprotein diacylglyceryl transferase [Longimicrobiaceae bacterium]|nr:prolipoprotein diacylglyceryl transferase [Longimicrobiaceae bacterium]